MSNQTKDEKELRRELNDDAEPWIALLITVGVILFTTLGVISISAINSIGSTALKVCFWALMAIPFLPIYLLLNFIITGIRTKQYPYLLYKVLYDAEDTTKDITGVAASIMGLFALGVIFTIPHLIFDEISWIGLGAFALSLVVICGGWTFAEYKVKLWEKQQKFIKELNLGENT